MAWVPSTRFEDDLVDMEPGFNLIHGQLDYEERRKKEFIPRPKNTYEYLSAREKRNAELESRSPEGEKAREIRQSLELMERIQRIAGTKPLGEHATMADLEDTSTVELEAVAMMRHFGMMSMAGVPLSVKSFYEEKHAGEMPVQGSVQVSRNGHRTFPLIMDPNYFTPQSWTSCNSVYESAKSDLESSISSAEVPKKSEKYIEIPYQLLEESLEEEEEKPPAIQEKSKGKRKGRRPNQKERQMSHKKQQYQL
ncbi:uncharacterized protein squ isoform X3 [Drosophila kikkawai]|uniref:Uncharacterized protein squ isoform X3 n=1 Tax=Drosophila kikkawai TaxID=30033 RepID=A0A6P4I900_DROKI|nr:uncharacterized protein LOC108072566 isoform X3 [Drosophila kikkawai]